MPYNLYHSRLFLSRNDLRGSYPIAAPSHRRVAAHLRGQRRAAHCHLERCATADYIGHYNGPALANFF
eukprot:6179903-Pleurochrysis_carterae.AAC.2